MNLYSLVLPRIKYTKTVPVIKTNVILILSIPYAFLPTIKNL